MVFETKEFLDYLKSERPKITYDYKAFKVALLWKGYDLNGVTFDMLLASYLLHSQMGSTDFKVVAGYFDYDDLAYDDLVYGRGAKKKLPEKEDLIEHIGKKSLAIFLLKDKIEKELKETDLQI